MNRLYAVVVLTQEDTLQFCTLQELPRTGSAVLSSQTQKAHGATGQVKTTRRRPLCECHGPDQFPGSGHLHSLLKAAVGALPAGAGAGWSQYRYAKRSLGTKQRLQERILGNLGRERSVMGLNLHLSRVGSMVMGKSQLNPRLWMKVCQKNLSTEQYKAQNEAQAGSSSLTQVLAMCKELLAHLMLLTHAQGYDERTV